MYEAPPRTFPTLSSVRSQQASPSRLPESRDRCPAYDVILLALEEALRNEEWEIGVLMTRRLEHVIEGALHSLPDTVAIGTNHHAAAHRRVVGELRAQDDLVVPGAEVLGASRQLLF